MNISSRNTIFFRGDCGPARLQRTHVLLPEMDQGNLSYIVNYSQCVTEVYIAITDVQGTQQIQEVEGCIHFLYVQQT
jgi:hypothetical protein